jgi:hypothetical protein
MAVFDSTQALDLLGKSVSVTEHYSGFTRTTDGVVLAVIVSLPGSSVPFSILVGDDYYDLDDIVLAVH